MTSNIPSVPLFVSVLAKGRGGGGSSGRISQDNWDAPPLVKTIFAFDIIWASIFLIMLLYIMPRAAKLPTYTSKGPYYLLVFVILVEIAVHVTAAISIRIDIIDLHISNQIRCALIFLAGVMEPLRPAVVLYLLHLRGSILRAVKGNTITPVAATAWKRAVDWTLVGLIFVFYIALLGVRVTWYSASENRTLTIARYKEYLNANNGLARTITAFIALVCLDVFISLIIHFVQCKRSNASDPVTTRLLIFAAPMFLIYGIESLAVDIYIKVNPDYDNVTVSLAQLIIEGICKTIIFWALLLTLMAPNVQWTSQHTAGPISYPEVPKQDLSIPNSGWNRPVFNQQQPYYQPQQQTYPQGTYYQPPQQQPPQHP